MATVPRATSDGGGVAFARVAAGAMGTTPPPAASKQHKSRRKISLPWFRQSSVSVPHAALSRQHTIDTPSSFHARLLKVNRQRQVMHRVLPPNSGGMPPLPLSPPPACNGCCASYSCACTLHMHFSDQRHLQHSSCICIQCLLITAFCKEKKLQIADICINTIFTTLTMPRWKFIVEQIIFLATV